MRFSLPLGGAFGSFTCFPGNDCTQSSSALTNTILYVSEMKTALLELHDYSCFPGNDCTQSSLALTNTMWVHDPGCLHDPFCAFA